MISDSAPAILTRPMVLMMVTSAGALTGFYLLLSVTPLYASRSGAGDFGAGLTTGVMMAATVAAELAVPWLIARLGYRAALALGAALLGLPTFALAATSALPVILSVSAARGVGLGIVVVAGTALAAELSPASRRAEGLGLYGVAVGVPSVAGLPVGVWLTGLLGFGPVFVIAAVVSLAPLPAVLGIGRVSGAVTDAPARIRLSGLMSPTLIFSVTTFAVGVTVTFLPLAVPASLQMISLILLVQSTTTPLARWWAGWFGDRRGSSRLLIPGLLACAFGMATRVWLDNPPALLAGAALFGAGFGVIQNATLAIMFSRVSQSRFGHVSVVWNLAFDAGIGVGGLGFGLVIGATGYPLGFALVAVLVLAASVLAWRDGLAGRCSRRNSPGVIP